MRMRGAWPLVGIECNKIVGTGLSRLGGRSRQLQLQIGIRGRVDIPHASPAVPFSKLGL